MSELMTEEQWAARNELRMWWNAFCDADTVPEGFIERMEEHGFAATRRVKKADLDVSFAWERGIEMGGWLWELTPEGERVFTAKTARSQSEERALARDEGEAGNAEASPTHNNEDNK